MSNSRRFDKHLTHKFKARQTINDGIKFASKKEAKYYEHLKTLKKSGEVLFFLRQVPFHLVSNVKYICDFQVFYTDGTIKFIDVKGYETPEFKLKKKQVEALYPVDITLV